MSFSQLEARIAAQYVVDTETQPKAPTWTAYKHVRFDMDGLVHRVTRMPGVGARVHDEAVLEEHPFTGCGIPLFALAEECKDDPERVGFCAETESLTCMTCASGLSADGDVLRQTYKQLLFGAAYGVSGRKIMSSVGRMSGKSYSLKAMAQTMFRHQRAMLQGHAAHVLLIDDAARRHRFSADFRRRLARAVLPL